MRLPALLTLAATALSAFLAGCATPEELAAVERKRQEHQTQTGTNIVRRDTGARTDAVTDKDAQDALLREMRNVPVQPVNGQAPGR
jgi:hypothetical protein